MSEEKKITRKGLYTHKFDPPFEWMGQTYETLDFDFGKLRGKDALAIEHELNAKGISIVMPAASVDYLIALASRASGLGSDAFEAMPMKDFNKIRSRARNFLISVEL